MKWRQVRHAGLTCRRLSLQRVGRLQERRHWRVGPGGGLKAAEEWCRVVLVSAEVLMRGQRLQDQDTAGAGQLEELGGGGSTSECVHGRGRSATWQAFQRAYSSRAAAGRDQRWPELAGGPAHLLRPRVAPFGAELPLV